MIRPLGRGLALVIPVILPVCVVAQAPILQTPLPPLETTPNQPEAPRPAEPAWLPRNAATLQFLDKVNARNLTDTVKVGGTFQYGALTVLVRACVVRPADRPADAAAFLVVTNSKVRTPEFSGWMLRSEPSLSMLEDPIYDVRVTGCAA
jgi:hypothetical protein